MAIIYVLIPLSLVLVAVALWAFFWATGNGQFDDLDSPAYDILDDDACQPSPRVETIATRIDSE